MTRIVRMVVRVACVLVGMFVSAGTAGAVCTWNANLNSFPAYGTESSTLELTWSPVPTSGGTCSLFTISKYRVVYKEGSAAPGTIDDGAWFEDSSAPWKGLATVNRSQRTYTGKVFACDNSSCSDVFGDGAGETIPASEDVESEATDQEVWVVTGVEPGSEGLGVLPDGSYAAASAYFRPTGWSSAGKLSVYYDDLPPNGGVLRMLASASGWLNFNDTTWSSSTEEAQDHGSDTDYNDVGHVYPFPVIDESGNDRLHMFAQNFDDDMENLNTHVVQVRSSSTGDTTWPLWCSDECCEGAVDGDCDWPADGSVAICADETETCAQLGAAAHGRWMWDLETYGPPDLRTENPRILFSGEVDDDDCAASLYGSSTQNDIFSATWDDAAEVWEVDMDGSCPEETIADAHDPGIIPMDDDEFKVYVMSWDEPHVARIHYWDGSAWDVNDSTPSFVFDDAVSTGITADCMGNFEGIYLSGHQGLIFDGHITGADLGLYNCTDGFNERGIYFAELSN